LPAADVVDVCYHQASYADAMTLRPFGHLERNANRWMFDRPADTPGPGYIVMSARGRSTSGTSAVDIVLKPGTPILAPVSGRVTKAKPYRLYDRYRDWRVEIAPDDQPQLRVVIIHLSGVRVRRGDRVSATLSVIGLPREFGFRSQEDDYVPGGDPHVHIEVKEPAAPGAP
jgi:murein DD-endopeptidase MepM/ murein hydrolase activator NlpD